VKAMLMKRVLAQIVDFVLGILTIFLVFTKGIPPISQIIANDFVVVLLAIVLMGSLYFLIQYPFMQNQQTLGKAFFHLLISIAKRYRSRSSFNGKFYVN